MDNVTEIVNNILEANGWRTKVLEQMAVELWPEVVGELIAAHTIAQKYSRGTLYVRARSPQWTHELHFHQKRIIARLNGRLRQEVVQRIRCSVTPPRGIRVGALKPNWEDPTFPEVVRAARPGPDDPDDLPAQKARRIAAVIEDPDMRRTVERLIATVMRVRPMDEDDDNVDNTEDEGALPPGMDRKDA